MMMIKSSRRAVVFRALLWLTLPWPSVAANEPIALTGRAMGTTWSVRFFQPSPPLDPASIKERITAKLEHIEGIFSTYRPASELSRFNATASTDWFPVSPELARVAYSSRNLSELTGGAFDATVEPLLRLWGFGPQRRSNSSPPSESEIAAARARVDYRRLEIRVSTPALRKISASLSADFSSMAKGFAADAISELLTALHATDHLAQIGGDIKTSGAHTWRTAIEQPTPAYTTATFSAVVLLSGQALSTSGDSRNFFVSDGRHYGHIIDPRTGRPVSTPLASVSVIHPSCATSSALATALFVLGPEAGFALAERERLPCLFIIRTGNTFAHHPTPEFKRLFPASP